MSETVWAWLGKREGWVAADAVGGPAFGCGSSLRPLHRVRMADGRVRRSYWTQYRDPQQAGADRPIGRVWDKGEPVWARLKAKGWTKARMFCFTWGGPGEMASVYLGRARGPSSYLVDRHTGLSPRDPKLAGRDKPE